MSNVVPFSFEGHGVRVVMKDNEPWWVASDVCQALDVANNRRATMRLDEDEKGVTTVNTLGGAQQMQVVNESGLYSLILTSRKESAKRFKRWVTGEVLPSIRKTGSYGVAAPNFNDPATLRTMLLGYTEKVIALEQKIEADVPKVEFYDTVADSSNSQTVQDVAKVFGMGPNKMFKFLRDNEILMEDNVPYQKHLDQGHFTVAERAYRKPGEEAQTYFRTYVTGKGQTYIEKRLRKAGMLAEKVAA